MRGARGLAAGVLGGLLTLLAGCGGTADVELGTAEVRVAGLAAPLEVEVADTEQARARGLMGRTVVPAGTGMLFRFDDPAQQHFWMKDTLVPLDIAWIRDGAVAGVDTMPPCPETVQDCPSYPSPGPVDAALEARAGTFDGVEVGARVTVTPR